MSIARALNRFIAKRDGRLKQKANPISLDLSKAPPQHKPTRPHIRKFHKPFVDDKGREGYLETLVDCSLYPGFRLREIRCTHR